MEETLKDHHSIGRVSLFLGATLMIAHAIGVANDWYNVIPWYDIPLHFLWGAEGALIFYWLIYRFPGYVNVEKNFSVTLVMVLGWVALGGVLWEFGEYLYDLIVYINGFSLRPVQFGLDDTLADIVFDLIGGIGIAVRMGIGYHNRHNYARQSLPTGRLPSVSGFRQRSARHQTTRSFDAGKAASRRSSEKQRPGR